MSMRSQVNRLSLWGLTGIILLGALLRLAALNSLPPAAWFDEIWFGLRARELLNGGSGWPVYYPTSFGGAAAGPAYLTALAHWLGFATVTGGRLMPALAGVISLPLAYACGRLLFAPPERLPDRRLTARLSAVVLAYSLFYVTIGRIGMEPGLAPAATLFFVWQFLRAARQNARSGWLLAGLTAGLAQYNGLHMRFLLPLAAFMAVQELALAAPAQRRTLLKGLSALTLSAALCVWPLLHFFLTNPEWLAGRAGIVTRTGPGAAFASRGAMLTYNTRMILRVFFIEGSYDPKNGVPGAPLLDPIQAIGLVVGLAWAVIRLPRSAAARLVIAWLLIMTLPSWLTEGAPNIGRMIGIAPPTAYLVAIGWAWIYGQAQTVTCRAGRSPAWLTPLALTLVAASLLYHTYLLFVRWPATPNLRQQFTTTPVEIAQMAVTRARGEPVFVERIPEAEDIAAFAFILPDTPVRRMDFRKCLPLPHGRPTRTTYVVISGQDAETIPKLQALYPQATVTWPAADLFQTGGSVIEIPAGAVAPAPSQPYPAAFESGISLLGFDWSDDQLRAGESLFVTLYWQTSAAVGRDLTAFAHLGSGLGGQPLLAQRDGAPCVGFYPTSAWQPGEVVVDAFALTLPPDAPPGDYPLSVGWYDPVTLERLPLLNAGEQWGDNRPILAHLSLIP